MEKQKPCIWLLLDSQTLGGIESHVLQLACGLYKHGINAKIIFLKDYGNHPLVSLLNESSIPYQFLDGRLSSFHNAIKQEKPVLIHTHGYKAGILGRVFGIMHKTPVISTFHAGEVKKGRMFIYDFFDRYTAWLASHVYTVSAQISSKMPTSTTAIRNFVLSSDMPTLSKGKKIAFVGRLSYEKGPDTFLRIAAAFKSQQFHVFGDGAMQKILQSQATNNVVFHGQQQNMQKVWPEIELMIMPSRFEGLPMAALEAMSHGIPVIAFNVGALEQLITHQKNGWLISNNSENLIIKSLNEWLAMSAQQKQTMKQAAQQTIQQHFSSDSVIPELIKTYQQFANITS